MKALFAAAIAASSFLVSAAGAVPTISVTPSLAPNSFGSPSYAGYVANAIGALHDGATSRGDATSPTYYQAQSTVTASQSIVTGFASWMGQADPASAYGAAFANELGNRMLFGVKVDGGGSQFSIDHLSFTASSSDAANALGFSFAAGHYVYGTEFEGVLKGADGMLFTADDVYVTGGDASQLVDGLIGRGSGASLAAYCDGCTVAQQQQAITDAASYFTASTTFTGTYTLLGQTSSTRNRQGSGAFTINPDAVGDVPEPASWALMIGGFGLVGGTLRRRAASLAFA